MATDKPELTGQPSLDNAASETHLTPAAEESFPSPGGAVRTPSSESRSAPEAAPNNAKKRRTQGMILMAFASVLIIWLLISTLIRSRAASTNRAPDSFSKTPATAARSSQLPYFAMEQPKTPTSNGPSSGGAGGFSGSSAGSPGDPQIEALRHQTAVLQAMTALRQAQYQYDNLRVNPTATSSSVPLSISFAASAQASSSSQQQPSRNPSSTSSELSARASYASAKETDRADSPRQSVVRAGTLLDGVLVNKLVTDNYTSPVIVMVDRSYYDSAERKLLIPSGTRILGKAEAVKYQTASRLAITFDTFQFPNGHTVYVSPDESALEGLGIFGLKDSVNRHTARILLTAGLVGILTGWNASQIQPQGNSAYSGMDQMRYEAQQSLSNTAEKMLSPYLNAVPTITVNEGHRLKIYISRDLPLDYYQEGPHE